MQKIVFFLFYTFLMISFPTQGQQLKDAVKIADLTGNENPVIDCSYSLTGNCLELKTSFPEFNETSSYSVSSEAFTPYGAFNAGTALKVDNDDWFTNKIKLPFNFCYFGINYSEIVVGTNGVITFDANQLDKINYPNLEFANPDISLPKNMIFGVFSDLVFSKNNDSEIYYSVAGAAPFRKFIVNFYKAGIVGCNETSTSQIVLSEGTNTVEIFVESKPLICANGKFKNSLLGIINADGTLGYSPAERNTGVWQAKNEAWKFTPAGATIIPEITWYDSKKEVIGNGETIKVCPEKEDTYSVEVKYKICGNLDLILKDSSSITFAGDYPVAKDFTNIFCGGNSFEVDLKNYLQNLTPQNSANFKFSFYDTIADAQAGKNAQPENFVLNSNRIFYVRIENAADPNCFRISTLNLQLIIESLRTNTLTICDFLNDGVEKNYKLSDFNSQLLSFPLNGTVHYFLSEAGAINDTNEVKTANLGNNEQFFIKYKTQTCSQIFGPITVNLSPTPVVNPPFIFKLTTCDFKRDYVEPFDFFDQLGHLVTTDPEVVLRFYSTYQQAFTGTGTPLITIKEGKYPVFVRVEMPGGCFSIATINLDITFTKVDSKDREEYICFNGTDDINIDINNFAPSMLVDSPTGIITTYFESERDAELDRNPISNLQTITENGDFVKKIFYVKFMDATGCYAVKALKVNLINVIIKQKEFSECDFLNDHEEKIILDDLTKRIIGPQKATVSYFITNDDAQHNRNAISAYNVQNSQKLFVRIESYGCSAVFEITINLVPTPIVEPTVELVNNSVCDNNNDGAETYDLRKLQTQIYKGTERVVFQFYKKYNPALNSLTDLIASPANFIVEGSTTVYAKVSLPGGCFSVSTISIKFNFLPAIALHPAVLQKCDYEFDLNETFNLRDTLPQVFIQSENSNQLTDLIITYYKTEKEANAGLAASQINPVVKTVKSRISFWVRFTSKTNACYSVVPIELQTYLPPKGKNSVIPDLCDDNLDGFYDVNLTAFTQDMVYTQSADNNFTFFNTKKEAEDHLNAIKNPTQFSFKPSVTRVWVRVENISGCFDTASVDFTFGKKITFDNAGPFTINDCDAGNDGQESVNLTQFEKTIYKAAAKYEYYATFLDLNNGANKIDDPKNYLFNKKSGPTKVFVKVSTAGFCPEKVEINLLLKQTPMLTLPDYYFCPGSFVDIKPDFSGWSVVKYEWFNPAGELVSTDHQLLGVRIEGTYKIKVTVTNGCSATTSFFVKTYDAPLITDLVANGNSFTVIATGSEKIIYSIDGVTYQDDNIFYNLPFGRTTFYVKYKDTECVGDMKEGLLLNLTNAFSPNDDGINDTWIIDDLYVFDGKKANLKIYNRFQEKVFEQESATRLVWDGKIGGRLVSSAAYWYILTLADGRVFNGWVLLKNRN